MSTLIKRFVVEDSGMEMLEWAIVAVLFAVAAAGAFSGISSVITQKLQGAANAFNAPATSSN